MNKMNIRLFFVLTAILIIGCNSNNVQITNITNQTIDSTHFLTSDYIELDKIKKISKFRSGIGHNYSDDFENCSSMKHYFYAYDSIDWSKLKIYSPADGRIVRIDSEWAGNQIHIQPTNHSNYNIILFHLNFIKPYKIGDTLKSGEQIAWHIGNQTYSDIAVSTTDSNKYKLISYFDILTDSIFQKYKKFGVTSKDNLIISKEARISNPLNCTNDIFSSEGLIENWFNLKK